MFLHYVCDTPAQSDYFCSRNTTILENTATSVTADLLERLINEQVAVLGSEDYAVSVPVRLLRHHISIPPTSQSLEEKAIFSYYPATVGYCIILTYLPDYEKLNDKDKSVYQLVFQPDFFQQWDNLVSPTGYPFDTTKPMEQAYSLRMESRAHFDFLIKDPDNKGNFNTALQQFQHAVSLLKFALEGLLLADESNSIPACGFLNNSVEREKILKAQDIILENLTTPLTIRELARHCGMNECYLKKGFKAMFGKTIYEFREFERIKKSQELILSKKMNINEVAMEMGYASHAYFSTSFKKITGIKPCDLLL